MNEQPKISKAPVRNPYDPTLAQLVAKLIAQRLVREGRPGWITATTPQPIPVKPASRPMAARPTSEPETPGKTP